MRILLDTNVLLRLSDAAHLANPVAESAIRRLNDAGHEPVLVPQVIYEFWVVATRPRNVNGLGLSVPEADARAAEWTGLFRLLRDERGVYAAWRALVVAHDVKGKNAHDARLAAAMTRHGLTHLLTFNGADFKRFPAVIALDPAAVAAGQLPAFSDDTPPQAATTPGGAPPGSPGRG